MQSMRFCNVFCFAFGIAKQLTTDMFSFSGSDFFDFFTFFFLSVAAPSVMVDDFFLVDFSNCFRDSLAVMLSVVSDVIDSLASDRFSVCSMVD